VATAVIVGITALICVIDVTRFHLASAAAGRPAPWLTAFALNAPSWILLGALAPLALFLSRRAPLGRGNWSRALAVHVVGAFVFAILHIAGMAVFLSAQRGDWATMPIFLNKFSTSLAINMLTYAAIVGAVHALRFYREAQTRVRVPGQTYQVTATIAGTMDRFQWALNSDPPLPNIDVLSLLLSDTAPSRIAATNTNSTSALSTKVW